MGTFKLMAAMFGMGAAITLGMGAAFVASEVAGVNDWLKDREDTRDERLRTKRAKAKAKAKEHAKKVKAKAARKEKAKK